MEHLNAIAKPSTFVCPDCKGSLWRVDGSRPARFDCSREGVSCDHNTFRDGTGRSVVETMFYDGPPFVKSHAWIGDNAGQFADPAGPSATDLLWPVLAVVAADGSPLFVKRPWLRPARCLPLREKQGRFSPCCPRTWAAPAALSFFGAHRNGTGRAHLKYRARRRSDSRDSPQRLWGLSRPLSFRPGGTCRSLDGSQASGGALCPRASRWLASSPA